MSLSKYESSVKHLARPVGEVYGRLADLRHLEQLKARLADPAVQEKLAANLPADKLEEARRQLENITFDADSIQLPSPAGNLKLRIVERDEPKCIKLAGDETPLPLYVWIQLLPEGDDVCKMRVTVGAEVSLFMKPMVSKPLSQAAEGLAAILSLV